MVEHFQHLKIGINMDINELRSNYDILSEYKEPLINIPNKPEKGLILLVGSSGSGKTTILKSWFKNIDDIIFDNTKSVIENFSTIEKGNELLRALGLKSIPTWFRPSNTLSNGEYHRAKCALSLDRGYEYLDEFTSVVDRDTAKALSWCLRKHHNTTSGLLVVATCHRDIEEWLCPDMIYDT